MPDDAIWNFGSVICISPLCLPVVPVTVTLSPTFTPGVALTKTRMLPVASVTTALLFVTPVTRTSFRVTDASVLPETIEATVPSVGVVVPPPPPPVPRSTPLEKSMTVPAEEATARQRSSRR